MDRYRQELNRVFQFGGIWSAMSNFKACAAASISSGVLAAFNFSTRSGFSVIGTPQTTGSCIRRRAEGKSTERLSFLRSLAACTVCPALVNTSESSATRRRVFSSVPAAAYSISNLSPTAIRRLPGTWSRVKRFVPRLLPNRRYPGTVVNAVTKVVCRSVADRGVRSFSSTTPFFSFALLVGVQDAALAHGSCKPAYLLPGDVFCGYSCVGRVLALRMAPYLLINWFNLVNVCIV